MSTAGQAAYEAYVRASGGVSLASGVTLPEWKHQRPAIRNAWNSAAQSVEEPIWQRIKGAMEIAENQLSEGDHHRTWAIDQMVRHLTGCPFVHKSKTGPDGSQWSYPALGESQEYLAFRERNPDWETGIAP